MRVTSTHGGGGGGCSDGTCPAIYDLDDPQLVAVQGATLTDRQALDDIGEIPAHETVVVLPRSLIESYAREHS
jgi:hypothetical protein